MRQPTDAARPASLPRHAARQLACEPLHRRGHGRHISLQSRLDPLLDLPICLATEHVQLGQGEVLLHRLCQCLRALVPELVGRELQLRQRRVLGQGASDAEGAGGLDVVALQVQRPQRRVFLQGGGQVPGTLVAHLVVGKAKPSQRTVHRQPGSQEPRPLRTEAVAVKLQCRQHRVRLQQAPQLQRAGLPNLVAAEIQVRQQGVALHSRGDPHRVVVAELVRCQRQLRQRGRAGERAGQLLGALFAQAYAIEVELCVGLPLLPGQRLQRGLQLFRCQLHGGVPACPSPPSHRVAPDRRSLPPT
mmetsp:Transcript_117854/g.375718  ORF Transcript_117854/g.375718 Transcript_117854/m.375718 type:complete len:303 (+) Transcript_117854:12-920(+)